MRLLKKVLRPIYKRFFERPLWSFLAKVKVFLIADFVAEIRPQIAAIEARDRAHWNALEQLLLSVLSVPEQRVDADTVAEAARNKLTASAAERDDTK